MILSDLFENAVDPIEENLRKWFKEKWVRFGPDGKIRGDCARGSSKEGKPKCLPQSKAHALGKKGRASAAAKKRREDPNPERRGAAKNVATRVKETVTDVRAGMAEIYRRLAPKIERHRDSFLAGQLYDELENYAELHGAEREFKQMMNGARNRAHMEYDTNPGGFHNWFWFLPFEEEQLEEISRRDFLKGVGATAGAAALGTPKGASAERRWEQDPISKAYKATMNADNFRGAFLTFNGENKSMHVNLSEPTNFSMKNIEAKRLYYPKITSENYTLKIGNAQPVQGKGRLFSFPLRQLGDYTGNGIVLIQGAPQYFDSIYQSFIEAEQIFIRIEIDNQPTTLTFTAESENRARADKARSEKIRTQISTQMQNDSFLKLLVGACSLAAIGEQRAISILKMLTDLAGASHPINQLIQNRIASAKRDPNWSQLTPDRLNRTVVKQELDTLENIIRDLSQVQENKVDKVATSDAVAEGADDIKKRMSKLEALALAANRAGDDAKCKMYQQKIQSLKQKLSQSMTEGWSDAIVSRRTGRPRTPYSVYVKGKKWKDFENDDHAEAVANKLRAKFRAEGRDPSVITVAPTDISEGAVDQLEQHRIDVLNDRMQELLARAKESRYKNNPAALSSIKQQYEKIKSERDSYYKVQPHTDINEKQDACYNKVKSRYKVWPSAYASGALVQCRKKGAANWGNKGKSK